MENGSLRMERKGEREYVFILEGEDHTIGSLLQLYLSRDERVEAAYYRLVHPLEDKIEVYIRLARDEDPYRVLRDAVERIIETSREMESLVREALREEGVEVED